MPSESPHTYFGKQLCEGSGYKRNHREYQHAGCPQQNVG
jgi:hypothetical protein